MTPDWREVWERVAAAEGGEPEPGKRGKWDRIRFPREAGTLVLDVHTVSTGYVTVTYTRGRLAFFARGDPLLKIKRRHPLDGIARLFGWRTIRTGSSGFDRRFVVLAREPGPARSLLLGDSPRRLLEAHPSFVLAVRRAGRRVRRRLGDRTRVVVAQVHGRVKDPEALRDLVEVAYALLEGLRRVGAAEPEPAPCPW